MEKWMGSIMTASFAYFEYFVKGGHRRLCVCNYHNYPPTGAHLSLLFGISNKHANERYSLWGCDGATLFLSCPPPQKQMERMNERTSAGGALRGDQVRRRAVDFPLPTAARVRAVWRYRVARPQAHPRRLERCRVPHELLHQGDARGCKECLWLL